jgi:Ni,Fe-hydrogenase III large subunit
MTKSIYIKNNQPVRLSEIPVLSYDEFMELNTSQARDVFSHCVMYLGWPVDDQIRLFCCMADDAKGTIMLSSARIPQGDQYEYPSFTAKNLAFHVFEREMHEKLGIRYSDHPWLKPLRFPAETAQKESTIDKYPFYRIESEELHEVGVGPIHAGVIEPGHFRFICNGEQILHLEIQLGYQHRGIEPLFLQRKTLLQRHILAENIAGDSGVGHTTAFASLWESLCGFTPGEDILLARTIASELERIAIHTGDLSAICTDIAYQLGSSVFGRLRTPVINTFQIWCGNRLAKGIIRAGKDQYPVSKAIQEALNRLFDSYEPDFYEMYQRMKTLPSILARLERTGTVTTEQAEKTGAVGMIARTSGLLRDIRWTHPYLLYSRFPHQPIIKHHGDVYSRTQIRKQEITQSIGYIRDLVHDTKASPGSSQQLGSPAADTFILSMTEGWRGEICHCAITDGTGELALYKIKDPSLHNWLCLALAVRNNDISDFPICNKSFDLSYCGHDL